MIQLTNFKDYEIENFLNNILKSGSWKNIIDCIIVITARIWILLFIGTNKVYHIMGKKKSL